MVIQFESGRLPRSVPYPQTKAWEQAEDDWNRGELEISLFVEPENATAVVDALQERVYDLAEEEWRAKHPEPQPKYGRPWADWARRLSRKQWVEWLAFLRRHGAGEVVDRVAEEAIEQEVQSHGR